MIPYVPVRVVWQFAAGAAALGEAVVGIGWPGPAGQLHAGAGQFLSRGRGGFGFRVDDGAYRDRVRPPRPAGWRLWRSAARSPGAGVPVQGAAVGPGRWCRGGAWHRRPVGAPGTDAGVSGEVWRGMRGGVARMRMRMRMRGWGGVAYRREVLVRTVRWRVSPVGVPSGSWR
ncbi:hypothetical protein ACIO53_05765 [Streptomyces sp. NPDC087305]|uniref:hypothetical protein n=1 Tax=Streptomyces sp. NPDC087305 TaxID=3365781 RepID=UPI003823BCBD